jgi:hypothetical protein
MRVVVLCFLLLLPLAGCLGNNNAPAPMNATNNSSSNVTAMLPKVLYNKTHAFAPSPSPPPAEETVSVPEGYTKLNLTVTFSASAGTPVRPPVGVTDGIDVKLGALDCQLPQGPVQGRVTCTKTGDAKAGDLKLDFSGDGDVSARVVVTAS